MTVQTQTIDMVPDFRFFERKQHRKLKQVLALTLVASVIFTACCLFTTISMVSMALGLLNSMGVFGDGELSEYIGYASVIGSVVGMAGNMVWPGGGIGSGYGADGFGVGHSTETYAGALNVADPSMTAAEKADYLKDISWSDQRALDGVYSGNTESVLAETAKIEKLNAAANAEKGVKVAGDVAKETKPLTDIEKVNQNTTKWQETQKAAADAKAAEAATNASANSSSANNPLTGSGKTNAPVKTIPVKTVPLKTTPKPIPSSEVKVYLV